MLPVINFESFIEVQPIPYRWNLIAAHRGVNIGVNLVLNNNFSLRSFILNQRSIRAA